MAVGSVKWFNDDKGFGFIEPDEGGGDVFAHFSNIGMRGFKTLRQGARVSFDLTQGPKGLLAKNVQVIADPEIQPQRRDSHLSPLDRIVEWPPRPARSRLSLRRGRKDDLPRAHDTALADAPDSHGLADRPRAVRVGRGSMQDLPPHLPYLPMLQDLPLDDFDDGFDNELAESTTSSGMPTPREREASRPVNSAL